MNHSIEIAAVIIFALALLHTFTAKQFDALSHQGRHVRMADGSVEAVFYNGVTETEMMGPTNGLGGVAARHRQPAHVEAGAVGTAAVQM